MEDRLKYILDLCIDWVKFAEAKNAALLVAASAMVFALVKHFPSQIQNSYVRPCFTAGEACLALSAVVCLISFIPQLKFGWIVSRKKTCSDDNLFFFGHIADYSAQEFVISLYQAEGLAPAINKLQLDLAGQVIINARIALKKFKLFTVSTWLAVVGVAFVVVAVVAIRIS